jgi:CheY-like chemotaxis protein
LENLSISQAPPAVANVVPPPAIPTPAAAPAENPLTVKRSNEITLAVQFTASYGSESIPMSLSFAAPFTSENTHIVDEWSSSVAAQIKSVLTKGFEMKYSRRRTMALEENPAFAVRPLAEPIAVPPSLAGGVPSAVTAASVAAATATTHTAEGGERTAPLRALVVDDAASNRKMCCLMLQKVGFLVDLANDGQEAVDKIFKENPDGTMDVTVYDIIMMDNVMPRLTGVDAVRVIRRYGYKGFIIGLTSDMHDEDMREFKYAGCNALLTKPLRLPLLKKTLASTGLEV